MEEQPTLQRNSTTGRGSRLALVAETFGVEPATMDDPRWIDIGFYRSDDRTRAPDARDQCVACLGAAVLTLMLDGRTTAVTAIRHVAVDPEWRGRGLFRALMQEAMAWCQQTAGPTLLYTEEAALYERFGFIPVKQHRFLGATPSRLARPPAAIMSKPPGEAAAWLRDRLVGRAPLSRQCSLVGAPDLVLANLKASDNAISFAPDLDAVIVHDLDDDTLVLVDVIAATLPSLTEVAARLPARPKIATLFPPDALGWTGMPVIDDTGLMARGTLPPAMRRPFMLPPTAEF